MKLIFYNYFQLFPGTFGLVYYYNAHPENSKAKIFIYFCFMYIDRFSSFPGTKGFIRQRKVVSVKNISEQNLVSLLTILNTRKS